MPYLNGMDFVATLLADTSVPYVPTVLMTGADLSEQAALLGVALLRKPFFVDKLLEVVEGQHSPIDTPPADHSLPAVPAARAN